MFFFLFDDVCLILKKMENVLRNDDICNNVGRF